jgi:hypothetical protein
MGRSTARCERCETEPQIRCGRCGVGLCFGHTPVQGRRCAACEVEWDADAPVRRAAKHIFVPPIAILTGGISFGLLVPLVLGGILGATAVAATATLIGTLAATATCRVIDHSARSGFLREHARALPAARLVTRRRRQLPAPAR